MDQTRFTNALETEISKIENHFSNPLELCNIFNITVPGNPCFVDFDLVKNMTYSGYSFAFRGFGPYVDYDSTIVVELQLAFKNPTTNEYQYIFVPLALVVSWDYISSTYNILSDDTFYYAIEEPSFDVEAILQEIEESFVVDYLNPVITDTELFALYNNGVYDAEVSSLRQSDFNNNNNGVILDVIYNNSAHVADGLIQFYIVTFNNGVANYGILYYNPGNDTFTLGNSLFISYIYS